MIQLVSATMTHSMGMQYSSAGDVLTTMTQQHPCNLHQSQCMLWPDQLANLISPVLLLHRQYQSIWQKGAAYPVQAVLVLARVGKADVLEGQYRGWQLVAVRELEVEGALMLHRRRQPGCLHLVQDLLFTLGLLHQVGVRSCGNSTEVSVCVCAQ